MPKIIQFLHTALEAAPNNPDDNFIPWNNHDRHRRKFLNSVGRFVDSERGEVDDELTFWGEWEAQSDIIKLKNIKPHLPHYLNLPFINPSVPKRTHNTDPYVFGENFRYIICKQGFSEQLRDLEPNSLILFGSSINKEFCIDTLFVVSDKIIKYSKSNIEKVFSQRNQYYHASVNPIYDDTNYNENVKEEDSCRLDKNMTYSFYKGVNFKEKDDYNGIYSFVPCKIYKPNHENEYIFKQPKLILDFISHDQTHGLNSNPGRDCTKKEIVEYWNIIWQQLEESKFLRGTWFKTPELRNR
jgi:hypothetical protein